MAKEANGYPIPDSFDPDGWKCIQLFIPDDYQWYSVVWGHLYELSKWYNWQRDDSQSGKFMADWFRNELDRARRCFDNSNCANGTHVNLDLTTGDGGLTYQEDFDIGCGAQQTPYTPSYGWGSVECYTELNSLGGWGVREDFGSVRDVTNPHIEWRVNSGGFVQFWQFELYYIDKDGLYHYWDGVIDDHDGFFQFTALATRRQIKGLFYRMVARHDRTDLSAPLSYLMRTEYDYLVIPQCPD